MLLIFDNALDPIVVIIATLLIYVVTLFFMVKSVHEVYKQRRQKTSLKGTIQYKGIELHFIFSQRATFKSVEHNYIQNQYFTVLKKAL